MALVTIWHNRDHRNGGRLSGFCYVNCNRGLLQGVVNVPVRCRFRFRSFEAGTRVAAWGVGSATGRDGYMLLIERTGDSYHPVVRYLNAEVTFSDIELHTGTLYAMQVYVSGGEAHLLVHDAWGNALWQQSLAASASGTLSTQNLYMGATCSGAGASQLHLPGTLFDLMYTTNGSSFVRLVFYEGHGGTGSGTVHDAFGVQNATVVNRPADFWSARTDISNLVTGLDKLRRETDTWGVPTFGSVSFTCSSAVTVQPHDVIEVEANETNAVNWLYRVEWVEPQADGLQKLHCIDALTDLEMVPADRFFCITGNFAYSRNDWWSNYTPVFFTGSYSAVEYFLDGSNESRRWVTLGYILQSVAAYLQLDNLVTTDIASLLDEDSHLRHNSGALHYRWLAFNLYELCYAGRGDRDDNASESMGKLLRQIGFLLRFTWLLQAGTLRWLPMQEAQQYTSAELTLSQSTASTTMQPHQLRQQRLQTGTHAWDTWSSSDIETCCYHNLGGSLLARNRVQSIDCTALLVPRHHDTVSNALLEVSTEPLQQLVELLDAQYCYGRELQSCTVPFTPSHHTRHLAKVDDVEAMTTELKTLR